MRCVIARFPFELTKSGVLESMKGVKPEPVTGDSVIIGRRSYPTMQVGEVITRQDRRDFSAREVLKAMAQLGFTCRTTPKDAVPEAADPLQRASAMLGTPDPSDRREVTDQGW
ncbi:MULTISPECIES: SCO5918 family protein [unclassified Streptomyces]|uniref:SCO5918 family protein n=1 Tax=unclassified Streptomyces TaxID=2593676 RepID=UPI0022B6B21D|nr:MULTISPECIES: SCO5918 family protein [unclassified Streptomyces]MCZ7414792.1 SCO5918 family protein [Streptomyces sp. WMMC897]MCZ7431736.1 SCO5918 family protein [Streptomyces sp. WMMC1477]